MYHGLCISSGIDQQVARLTKEIQTTTLSLLLDKKRVVSRPVDGAYGFTERKDA